jgi:hypothetical protein
VITFGADLIVLAELSIRKAFWNASIICSYLCMLITFLIV